MKRRGFAVAEGAVVKKGTVLFAHDCMVCHGFGAIGGGSISDLRYSTRLQSSAEWAKVVVGGDRTSLGMPSFTSMLSAQDAELIRAYVVRQATMAFQTQPPAAVAGKH